jgi:hypothetical protein
LLDVVADGVEVAVPVPDPLDDPVFIGVEVVIVPPEDDAPAFGDDVVAAGVGVGVVAAGVGVGVLVGAVVTM